MWTRIKNLLQSGRGWSFAVRDVRCSRKVLDCGEIVVVAGETVSDGMRLGTVYVRILIADSYDHDHPVFDSDRDLSRNEKQALRLLDIEMGGRRTFACEWAIPPGTEHHHFDVRVEIWNPHRLFEGPNPHQFDDSGWVDGFEVLGEPGREANDRVSISYSWDGDAHKAWVLELAEELSKHDVSVVLDQTHVLPGDDTTLFMEKAISEDRVVLLICSEKYTSKADSRSPGGVGYETVITAHEYSKCGPEDRTRFIPVVRNNTLSAGEKLPRFLGSAWFCDMEGEDWRGEPMIRLLSAIRRHRQP